MKLRSVLFSAALALGLSAGGLASAATIAIQTTHAQAATAAGLTGGATVVFDNMAKGFRSGAVSSGGVSITSDTGNVIIDDALAYQYNTNDKYLTNQGLAFNELYFDFAAPVEGFGFFFGASDNTWELTAFDGANNILETLLIPVTYESNTGDFFGLKRNGIARARLTNTGGMDYVTIDNFIVGAPSPISAVPEPATWAMLIAGFGAVGSMVRTSRRRQALA